MDQHRQTAIWSGLRTGFESVSSTVLREIGDAEGTRKFLIGLDDGLGWKLC